MRLLWFIFLIMAKLLNILGQDTLLLSPKQMKKDIDFFFNFVSEVHPNMYAFVPKDSMEKRKCELYEKCLKPLTKFEFQREIRQLNSMFDGHTAIIYKTYPDAPGELFFPLNVIAKGKQLYLAEDEDDREILSINDIPVPHLLQVMTRTFNVENKAMHDLEITFSFPRFLFVLTTCRSPFTLCVKDKTGKDSVFTINGKEQVHAWTRLFTGTMKDFSIYDSESIAILNYNSCRYTDKKEIDEFAEWVDWVFKKLSDDGIKHLFIDISHNGGGNPKINDIIFRKIEHDSVSYPLFNEIKISSQLLKRDVPLFFLRPVARIKYGKNYGTTLKITYSPVKGYNGNIYLIQGPVTFSAALEMAAWFRYSGRATIIGEETGGMTAGYTNVIMAQLPYSKFPIQSSCNYYEYPNGQMDRGFLPDVPIKLDYTKAQYELEDLKRFLKMIEENKKTW